MRFAFSGLLSCAERKVTAVTPSPLLAAVANRQFANNELRLGRLSWERPAIYSVSAWLANCWQEARFSAIDIPILLSGAQERLLWRQIIQREHAGLFDVTGTARLASRAASVMADWHIPSRGDAWNEYEDAREFQRWLEEFRRICGENQWATRADLWRLLPALISRQQYAPRATVFAGFESLTPALQLLVDSEPGLFRLAAPEARAPAAAVSIKKCGDFAEQVEYAARWARAEFEGQAASIAVFVPDLRRKRALVERTFRQIFYPGEAFRESRQSVFHIGAAAPLFEHPLVAAALLFLELARPRIAIGDAGSILRSPFLGGANEERSARSLADVDLRRKRGLYVSLRELEWSSRSCPALTRVWPAVRRALRGKPEVAELSEWGEFIGRLLKATGWPGDEQSSNEEQAVIEAWEDALAGLTALELVSEPVNLDVAIAHLRGLLATGLNTGDWDSPVQVLDAAQAAGLESDAAMVTGLSDETWPPTVEHGSPLIPLKQQRAQGVPGSSPQSLRGERERLTRAVFSAAPAVHATYSKRLASAARGLVTREMSADDAWTGKTPWQSFQAATLVELEDSQAPSFVPAGPVRGGTRLIKAQSQCPFRAFAEFRLRASALEDGVLGMDALARGTTLHTALELVWRELKSSEGLRSKSHADLASLAGEAIAQAVRMDESSGLQELVTSVERERLQDLILEWLDVERERLQPFTVELLEGKRDVDLAGLPIQIRLDRVDRLNNGCALLLDYKSGKQTKNALLCPRPNEPQLLVYAATADEDVDGLLLIQLQARDCKASGFTRERQFERRTVDVKGCGWDRFLEEAKQEVFALAKQFRSGWAAVHPSNGACDFCACKPLCRVNENAVSDQDSE